MTLVYSTHENALNLLFSEVRATAEEQLEAFMGAPGSLALRTNETGTDFCGGGSIKENAEHPTPNVQC